MFYNFIDFIDMKKSVLLLLLLIVVNLNAQLIPNDKYNNKKYSFETFVFLNEINKPVNKVMRLIMDMPQQYLIYTKDGIEYTKVHINVSSNYSVSDIEAIGGKELVRTKSVALVSIPIDNIPLLAEYTFIDRIEVDMRYFQNLDSVISITRTGLVHQGYNMERGFMGDCVIVGVVDYGFDFTNPMFYDADGNLRIKRAWMGNFDDGNPPEGFDNGTLYDDIEIKSLDIKSSSIENYHGSHVLGIAAGSRVKGYHTEIEYEGVAPGSEIAVVDLGDRGVLSIVEGLTYLYRYADSVGKPIVVNMSLGSNMGPGDGTSLRELQMSEIINNNDTGKVLVVSAGNSGNSNSHILMKPGEYSGVSQKFAYNEFYTTSITGIDI